MKTLWTKMKYRIKLKLARMPKVWYGWYNLKYGIENIFYFLPTIWRFRDWDYHFNIDLFAKSIEKTANTIQKYGMEVEESKSKKIEKMGRFVWLAENYDNALELAEKELGKIDYGDWTKFGDLNEWFNRDDPHRKKVYARSEELEKEMWEEMWTIIRGTENEISVSSSGKEYKWSSDGTCMLGWWD